MAPFSTDPVGRPPASVEGRGSWVAALSTLAILSLTYGGPLIVVVGMTDIQASLGTDRSSVGLAVSMVWIGAGLGGVVMGHVAERIGMRATAMFGAVMMAAGLFLSSFGTLWALLVGQGVFMGLLGNGALYAPLVVYVSRWFDRRRGTAIALIASGQYVAGVLWPQPFERLFAHVGWQMTMRAYAALIIAVVVPLALLLRPHPGQRKHRAGVGKGRAGQLRPAPVLGLQPGLVQVMLCCAAFLCCVPMAIPVAHLVAFSSSLGIGPDQGAAMLSVLLAAAFIGRQSWGWLADRIGPLTTLFLGELCQVTMIAAFAFTTNEAALFGLAAAYGLGFAGIIPSYVLAIRGFFPAAQASWRVPLVLLTAMSGMAFGSWFAGALFDRFGLYAPAFEIGVLFNLVNIAIVSFLFVRWRGLGAPLTAAAA